MVSGPKSSLVAGIGSFFQGLFHSYNSSSSMQTTANLGTLWQTPATAKKAWTAKTLCTTTTTDLLLDSSDSSDTTAGQTVRVTFRNTCADPLLLCWVDESGQPHHFYTLEPSLHDTILQQEQAGVPLVVTADDHTEQSRTGHAFVLAHCSSPAVLQRAIQQQSLENTNNDGDDEITIVGGYRPSRQRIQSNKDSRYPVHIVTVQPVDAAANKKGSLFSSCSCWCLPKQTKQQHGNYLRKRKYSDGDNNNNVEEGNVVAGNNNQGNNNNNNNKNDIYKDDDYDNNDCGWELSVETGELDPTPYDTTTKRYLKTTVGGWPVRCETCWHGNDPAVKKQLERDLRNVCKCIPKQARDILRKDTCIWVNRSLLYGPAASPEQNVNLCFHPDVNWLIENGCHEEKAKCVEMYSIQDYCITSQHWGPGGVLIHELSHAYHNKCLPNGYENVEIQACYEAAMKEGLYESVRVHGTQGPTAKAYACDNCMEYFAELSTAFLGGLDDKVEFNKWYPFNRKQLKEHDPRAYELLKRLWKVDAP